MCKKSFNYDKLIACIYILNHTAESYYNFFKDTDAATFSEFKPCGFKEEIDILSICITRLLNESSNNDLSENVIYWGVCCYYFATTVLDYTAVNLSNHLNVKKHYEKKILPLLKRKIYYERTLAERVKKESSLRLIEESMFLQDEIDDITGFLLKIASGNDECFSFIRKIIQHAGEEKNNRFDIL